MPWFFAAVVLVLAVVSRPFRKVVVVLIALIAIGSMGWYGYYVVDTRLKTSRVKKSEVALENVTFEDAKYGGYQLAGRLRNNSAKPLTRIDVELVIKDCDLKIVKSEPLPGSEQKDYAKLARENGGYLSTDPNAGEKLELDETKCDAVAQETVNIYVSVPPGQVRDVTASVYLSPEPVFRRGARSAVIDIVKTYADRR